MAAGSSITGHYHPRLQWFTAEDPIGLLGGFKDDWKYLENEY